LTGRHETADMNTFSWVWVPCIACILDTVHCWTGTWVLAFCWITTFLHSNGIKGLTFYLQGVANRGASIRVGRDTEREGKGEAILKNSRIFFVMNSSQCFVAMTQ
jgi:hypothetical protein